jgi:hypothetical protein
LPFLHIYHTVPCHYLHIKSQNKLATTANPIPLFTLDNHHKTIKLQCLCIQLHHCATVQPVHTLPLPTSFTISHCIPPASTTTTLFNHHCCNTTVHHVTPLIPSSTTKHTYLLHCLHHTFPVPHHSSNNTSSNFNNPLHS